MGLRQKMSSSYSLVFLQLSSLSFFVFEKKETMAMNRHSYLWFCCNEEGDGTKLSSPSLVVVLL
jgi:hypothetical protein